MTTSKNNMFIFIFLLLISFLIGCTMPSTSGKSSGSNNAAPVAANNSANIQMATTSDSVDAAAAGGLKGDGSDETDAINSLISSISSSGGGTLEFTKGSKGVYGAKTIVLKSNVTLKIDSGVTIRALSGTTKHESNKYSISSGTYQDYGHSFFKNALITGDSVSNIKIIGNGTIDGNGVLTTSNPSDSNPGDKAISLKKCNNIEIGGVVTSGASLSDDSNKLKAHKGGHFFVLATGCTTVNIHDVYVHNSEKTGTRDVFDIMECSDVTVNNIYSEYSSDDVVKFGSDCSLGYPVMDSSNITVSNVSADTNCNVVMIGSETVGKISNYHYSNITARGTGKSGVGILSVDGSIINGVTVDGVSVFSKATIPVNVEIMNRNRYPHDTSDLGSWKAGGPCTGSISNISISNVTVNNGSGPSGQYTATIAGFYYAKTKATSYINNVTINNVKIQVYGKGSSSDAKRNPPEDDFDNSGADYNPPFMGTRPAYGWFLRHVKGITFTKSSVSYANSDARDGLVATDCSNVSDSGLTQE